MKRHKTKILFIQPPVDTDLKIQRGLKYPPLGIAFLSAAVREKGYDVKIFDANVERRPFQQLQKVLREYAPDVVGISFTSLLAESARYTAGFIKRINPGVTVVAGGYHPTVVPLEVMKDSNFDLSVVGEGEYAFIEWLEKYETSQGHYEQLSGVVFRKGNKIVQTEKKVFMSDIDRLPFPAYDLLHIERYSSFVSTRKPYVTFIRSRGCPFRCIFCGVQKMFGHKYRCQSPEKTVSEIDILIRDFNVKEILFKDSDFLVDRNNVERLCELLIKRKYDLIWSCNARVDKVNEKLESGNQEILNRLRKDITLPQIIKAVELTKKSGIQCTANIIFGTPGETRIMVEETLRFVKRLDPDYGSFTYLTAFPGSILYDEALRKNWFIDGKPNSFAYEKLRLNATEMSDKDLSQILKYATRSFYLRRKYISKRLKYLTFAELKNDFKGLWAVMRNC
jgi:radical SAM superfamily enzyme YgiQ (UPF0313 family)